MDKYDFIPPKKRPAEINDFNPGKQAIGCLIAAVICAVGIVIALTFIIL